MLREIYLESVKTDLREDLYQLALVETLEHHAEELRRRCTISGTVKSMFKSKYIKRDGIYIWGGVGRGKSFISAMFYKTIKIPHKQHFHFHSFMLEIHRTMQYIRDNNPSAPANHLMKLVVRKMLPHCKLLYLDELQINNIADAMIMERLFLALKYFNIFTIVTSNRKPSDLFLDGLNRDRFLPFIDNIQRRFEVFNLDGNLDYRSEKASHLTQIYFHPLNDATNKDLAAAIAQITDPAKLEELTIHTDDGRALRIMSCYGATAVFNFSELCDMPMGAADYMAICHHFKNIIIRNIPELVESDHNQALRFITLIDCLYESKTRLICSAATPMDEIYSGNRNHFEFARTISRLKEMQKPEYLAQSISHITCSD